MEKVWGDQWSVTSEIGKLRSVLMHRPGKEIEGITDPSKIYFRDFIDVEKARWEHDQLAQVYRDHGIEVNYVEEMDPGCPNAMYCHDLILGTPEGVIVTRPGIEIRHKEVKYAAQKAAELGVPIVKTVHGKGIFDGACATWVDKETAIVGTGSRCNGEGLKQVSDTFRGHGREEHHHPLHRQKPEPSGRISVHRGHPCGRDLSLYHAGYHLRGTGEERL